MTNTSISAASIAMLALSLKHCWAVQAHRAANLAYLSFTILPPTDLPCLSFSIAHSIFLPSPRPGVPLGAEAICGGGGRTSAQEQQADDGQQLSGGTLCGSLLLSTLGEWKGQRRQCFLYIFYSLKKKNGLLLILSPGVKKGQQEETKHVVETDKREEQEGGWDTIVLLCLH